MDFTTWVEGIKPMTEIVQILAGLGLVTAALAYAKDFVERRRWDQFKRLIDSWLNRQVESKEIRPAGTNGETEAIPTVLSMYDDESLTIIVEQFLSDVGFTPLQIQQLLRMALLILRGMATDKFLI